MISGVQPPEIVCVILGEQPLADAVRAVARLPRAKALVLAGSLMGRAVADTAKFTVDRLQRRIF